MHDHHVLAEEENRRERVADAIAHMETVLELLDQLGLAVAAAHVSMAADMARKELDPPASAPSS